MKKIYLLLALAILPQYTLTAERPDASKSPKEIEATKKQDYNKRVMKKVIQEMIDANELNEQELSQLLKDAGLTKEDLQKK